MSADIDRRLGYSLINSSSNRESQNMRNLRSSSTPPTYGQKDDLNASRLAAQEIVKPSQGSNFYQSPNSKIYGQFLNQNIPSNSQDQPKKTELGVTYTVWGEMIKDQAQIARKEAEQQKLEERIRKQRYR